eukprot:TRINITY_DN11146_c0_g1_i1.p1 TRINITY_DN11146_c0_g1~~TRINITY_DN11146_c0_g1_i1.p1  ORF type:complete len:316 (+),score=46.38 TRINITY_DN11146_c0_g1_i1:139-1086(+)
MARASSQQWQGRRQPSWSTSESQQGGWPDDAGTNWRTSDRLQGDGASWWPEEGGASSRGGRRSERNSHRRRSSSAGAGRADFEPRNGWSQPGSGKVAAFRAGSGRSPELSPGRRGGYQTERPCGYTQDWQPAEARNSGGYGPSWQRSATAWEQRSQPYFNQSWQAEGPGQGQSGGYRGRGWRRRAMYRSRRFRSLPAGYGRHMIGSGCPAEVFDMMFRDITPEDYEALLALDESVKRPTAEACDLESLPEVSAEKKEGQECGVCLSAFESDDSVTSLPCRHLFHRGCIVKWLAECRRTCPLCGGEVSAAEGSSSD